MAKGFDFGTAILVSATKTEDGKTATKSERNAFIDVGEDFRDVVNSSNYNFVEDEENGEKRLFIIGKDAIVIDNLLSSKDSTGQKVSNLRRPMQNMVINSKTDKKAIKMLKHMSQALVGPPKTQGEVCVISIPSGSLDGSIDPTFHSSMCESFISELGYEAIPINEALAVIYATNPTIETEDEGVLNFSGIGISFGGGGSNGAVAYKGKDLVRFAVARGGDWIDKNVAAVTSLTPPQVTVAKEKESRVGNFDLSKDMHEDDTLNALQIFYKNLIVTVVNEFKKAFLKEKISFEYPVEVVVSGGTSKPNGFENLVEKVISEVGWPFKIKGVRKAKDPLAATAAGCLTYALLKEKNNEKAESKSEHEVKVEAEVKPEAKVE